MKKDKNLNKTTLSPASDAANTITSSTQTWLDNFSDSIFNGLSPSLAKSLSDFSEQEKEQRFSIYQNNVFHSLTTALADLYPVIKTLVGDIFFNNTAKVYIREDPPSQAAMINFGWSFVSFLSNFEHTQKMPYLADVAKLELARHKAYHSRDDSILEQHFFADIDHKKFENAKLNYHPSFNLLSSSFPIFSIWKTNHKNAPNGSQQEKSIYLDKPQWVIILRYNFEVLVFHVDYVTYLFHQSLSKGMSVIEAANYCYIKEPNADISNAIALGITNGFFSGLTV